MTELDDRLLAARPGDVVTLTKRVHVRGYTVIVPAGVTLDGRNATIRYASDGRDLPPDPRDKTPETYLRGRASVRLSPGASLRRLVIEGANSASTYSPDVEAQHGIVCSGGNEVSDVAVTNVFGDCLYARGDNVTLKRFRFSGSGRMGVGRTTGSNMVISDGSVDRVARSVFDLEPIGRANEAVVGFSVFRVRVGSYGLGFSGQVGGAVVAMGGSGPVSQTVFEDIQMTGTTPYGNFVVAVDSVAPRTDLVFRRCRSAVGAASNRSTYDFFNAHKVVIDDCYQEFATRSGTHAVRAYNTTDLDVTNCEFPGAHSDVVLRG